MATTYINLKYDILHIHLNNYFNGDIDGNHVCDVDDSVTTVTTDGTSDAMYTEDDSSSAIISDLIESCA